MRAATRNSRSNTPIEFHAETNLEFQPRVGRYVRIEIGANTAGYPWSVAELEIYGVTRHLDAPSAGAPWSWTRIRAPLQFARTS